MTRSHPLGLRRQLGRRWLRVSRVIVASSLSAPGLALTQVDPLASPAPNAGPVGRIIVNDNRTPGGTLERGVLTIRLEARTGEWHPDGDADPGVVIRAFGEEGKPLQIPGPLIRVPKGTEIHAFIRNSLDSTLIVRGLHPRGVPAGDTVQIEPGNVREVRFTAGTPGTYYYWANLVATSAIGTRAADSQLSGALVIDSASPSRGATDRIFVLGLWDRRLGLPPNQTGTHRFVINGKAWPNTERLAYTVGDTSRFRFVNTSSAPHPMHLHGFYFTVDSRGDGTVDSVFTGSPRYAVTERAAPGRTFSLTWVPERAGNWMIHCHDNVHTLRNSPLDGSALAPDAHMAHVKNHALEMMGGLVMGVEVRPKGTTTVAAPNTAPRRHLRLIARVDSAANTDSEPAYGYVLQDGRSTMPPTSPLLPGPTILLQRGEPVTITVVNELPEATAVHWHGIELESYYDGVAGFSGTTTRPSPVIAPRDSFEARFTPPRSGTFIYHPHADEVTQQRAGLSGALVVVDDPRAYDPAKDIVLLVSTPRRQADATTVFLNGTNTPAPIEMRTGERYRLRIINIHTARPSMIMRFGRDSTVLTWRAVAKDGRTVAPDQATVRPAVQQMGNGEAFDYEVVPATPGDYRFWVTSGANVPLVSLAIRVR